MNRDVFLSLLALDAYNRGYGAGVNLDPATTIGTATIGEDAETLLGPGIAEAAGFYAIAYNWNGETIISFRGTNFPSDPSYPRHCEATQSPWQSREAPREALMRKRPALKLNPSPQPFGCLQGRRSG